MAERGMNCIKYILGAFNLALVVLAILIIALEAKEISTNKDSYGVVEMPTASNIALCTVGVILFIIAFLGCWGSFRENHCMLISYGVILLILLVLQVVFACLIFFFRNQVETLVTPNIIKEIKEYDFDQTNSTRVQVIDKIQSNLKCCGAFNYTDYLQNGQGRLPLSCCGNLTNINETLNHSLDDKEHLNSETKDSNIDRERLSHYGFNTNPTYSEHQNEIDSSTSSNKEWHLQSPNTLNTKVVPSIDNMVLMSKISSNSNIAGECAPEMAYQRGCVDVMGEGIINNYGPICGVAVSIALIQLLGITFACFFAHSIKHGYETV